MRKGSVFADSPIVYPHHCLIGDGKGLTMQTGRFTDKGQQTNLQAALSERTVHRTADFSLSQISEKRLRNWLCNRILYPHPAVEVAEATTTGDGGMMTKKKNMSLIRGGDKNIPDDPKK